MRTIIENAVPAELARQVVGELDALGWIRYALIDRGQYDYIDDPPIEAVSALLARIASEQLGYDMRPISMRALRFGPGDYTLSHHDARHDEPLVECIADLSVTSSPFAVHYREGGRPHFVVPNEPRSVSVVARTAASAANHTYVSKLFQGSAIVRFVGRFVT